MEKSYLDDLNEAMTAKLEEAELVDSRLRCLYKRLAKAQKRKELKEKFRIGDEIEARRRELAEELIKRQIIEDQKQRAFARYMSGEEAEKYNLLRDAINITYDALETMFMDMADIVKRNTEFVEMEFPRCFKDCMETIRGVMKEEKEAMNGQMQDTLADVSDNLVTMIMNKAKSYQKKIKNDVA